MLKNILILGVWAVVAATVPHPACGQEKPTPDTTRTILFDRKESLADWTIDGDAAVDLTKGRDSRVGALKVGPGGKALLKLRDRDESGRAEFWVYDDLTTPENPKAPRIGPRWGLVQGDGRVLAVGILYASYLGGGEGYTASASDGRIWVDQLYWLGVNRTPAAWHKWTINFDPETGLQILHDGHALNVDTGNAGLKGFRSIAIWGDNGTERGQTIWVGGISVALGGPARLITRTEADPYSESSLNADTNPAPPSVIYAADLPGNARSGNLRPFAPPPVTPRLENLSLEAGVSEFGITLKAAVESRSPARRGA